MSEVGDVLADLPAAVMHLTGELKVIFVARVLELVEQAPAKLFAALVKPLYKLSYVLLTRFGHRLSPRARGAVDPSVTCTMTPTLRSMA